jgi:hypothetical protein
VYFYYDDTAVVINTVSPNAFGTTTFTGYTMNIKGNVTGNDLTLVNRTIRFPNSSVYLNDEVTSFVDNSTYSWDNTYDTTDMPNGVYSMNIYAEDLLLHTNNLDTTFTISNCVAEWVCNHYTSCNESDLQSCDGVGDVHSCGLTYTGDYSEFEDLSCNFCSADVELQSQTACINKLLNSTYIDNNYDTCCAVTGLPSDCLQNASIVVVEESCSPYYEENDIPKAIIDTIGRAFVFIANLFPK